MDWIDWLFDGMRLFESGIWFIGGLILCLVGALIVGDSLAFRRRAYKAKVLCLGIIPNTTNEKIRRSYHPVYQYTSRDGELVTFKFRKARSLRGHFPNTWHTLLVNAEDKYDLRGTIPWQLFLGVMVVLWGFGLFKIASVSARSLLWAGLAALVLILGKFLYAFIKSPHDFVGSPRMRQATPRRKSKSLGMRFVNTPPDTFEMSQIMSERDQWRAILKEDWSQLTILPFVLLLAVPLLLFGGSRAYSRISLTIEGQRTDGTVVRIDTNQSSDSTSYYTIVEFADDKGKTHEVSDTIGSSSPMDQRGDKLAVLYDPLDPERALIDRGFWSWLVPIGLPLLGLLLLGYCGATVRNYFSRRKLAKQILAEE